MASPRKPRKKNRDRAQSKRLKDAVHSPYQTVPVDLITIPRERLREIDEDTIRDLAISIDKVGLINPLTVRVVSERPPEYRLIAGNRRLHAVRRLGWTEVAVQITELDDIRSQLVEIDENFQRQQLTALETAEHIEMRERILDELGLRAPTGAPTKGSESDPLKTTSDLAADLGMSKSSYKATASIARHIPRKLRERVHGTPLANQKTKLVEISKLDDGELQELVIDHIIESPKANVKKAIEAVTAATVIVEVEEPTPELLATHEKADTIEVSSEQNSPAPPLVSHKIHIFETIERGVDPGRESQGADAVVLPWEKLMWVASRMKHTELENATSVPVFIEDGQRWFVVHMKSPAALAPTYATIAELRSALLEVVK